MSVTYLEDMGLTKEEKYIAQQILVCKISTWNNKGSSSRHKTKQAGLTDLVSLAAL